MTVGNTKWRCLIDDTHNVTPTEGANWTIYLESATSLAGMDDVTLTSPKNGDGLVHDGNDWKNIPIMTKEQWKKNGAYNLLPNKGSTQVSYGLTFTFNPTGYKKGVVHVTGTKSDSGSHGITLSGVFNLKAGTYKILDGLSNNNLGIALFDNSTSTVILQTYNQHEATFTLATDTEVRCTIVFLGAQNTTFDDYIYPMITTDLNATPADYVPYAKTNRQLTDIDAFQEQEISVANGYSNNNNGKLRFQKRNGVVTCLWSGGSPKVPSALTDYNIATIPSGYVPKYEVCVPCVNLNTFSDGVLFMFKTNGEVHIIGYSTTTNQLVNSFPTVSYVVKD